MNTFTVYLPGDVPATEAEIAEYRKERMRGIVCYIPGFAKVYSSIALFSDGLALDASESIHINNGIVPIYSYSVVSAKENIGLRERSTFEDISTDRIVDIVFLIISASDPVLYNDTDDTFFTDSILVPAQSVSNSSNADRSSMTITDSLVTINKYHSLSDNNELSMGETNELTQDNMIRTIS